MRPRRIDGVRLGAVAAGAREFGGRLARAVDHTQDGAKGIELLKTKLATGGFRTFYNGGLGAGMANIVGYYPWFATYITLEEYAPVSHVTARLRRSEGHRTHRFMRTQVPPEEGFAGQRLHGRKNGMECPPFQ